MFCPVCHAEFRPGITICSDCHVALAPQLVEGPGGTSPEVAYELIYQGTDEIEFSRVAAALEDAGLHFHEAVQVGGFVYASLGSPRFHIWIAPEDRPRANQLLTEILGNLQIEELPEPLPNHRGEIKAGRDSEPQEWDSTLATEEVWSGEDGSFAEFFATTLRENGIETRLDDSDRPLLRLYLYPGDLSRGQEILKEIQQGEPLED